MTTVRAKERARRMARVKKLYEDGISIRAVAEREGWSKSYTHKLLRESGAQLRPRSGSHNRPPLTEEERAELVPRIVELYRRGLSAGAIAEKEHRSRTLIQRLLHEAGVNVRGRGGKARHAALTAAQMHDYRIRLAARPRR